MDLLLTDCVADYVNRATVTELAVLEKFLQENELDISQWLLTQTTRPEKYNTLIEEILIFNSRD